MNQGDAQQGAAAQQQGQQQNIPLEQRPAYKSLLKPGQIQNFNHLGADKKQQFQNGMAQLWQVMHRHGPETNEHKTAYQKLTQVTKSLITDARRAQQAAQQGSQGSGQASQQAQQAPGSTAQGQVQAPQQQQRQQPQAQAQQASVQRNVSQPGSTLNQTTSAPSQQGQQGQQRELEIPEQYIRKVEGISWMPLPNSSPENLAELKKRYAAALYRRDTNREMLQKISQQEQQLQAAGQQIPPSFAQNKAKFQAGMQNAMTFIQDIANKQKALNANNAAQRGQNVQDAQNNQSQAGNATQAAGQQMAQQQQQQQQQPQQQQQQPQANTQAQRPPQMVGAPSQAQQGNAMQGVSTPTSATPTGQLPQNNQGRLQQAGAPQLGQQQSFTRPLPGPSGQQFAGGQTASPQTTMAPQGPPVPYNHQTAINAARSYSTPQISQPNSAQPNGQNAFQRAEGSERQTKNTNGTMRGWTPQAPQPVAVGASRPTLTGSSSGLPGMMGQPAIAQQPSFSLHGQGDRVMDKKKLDELVRQVAGAGNGVEQQSLQPDVEESMLALADEFIDNVVSQACRLAKSRQSTQLELRDLQVVLERYYNIRIPGYALDDNRTVRKVQPAPGYLQKVNAVQAAKVMGGKTDI